MRAITVRQPWADLIAHGIKTIEVRTWEPQCRGLIAIHAARNLDRKNMHRRPESAATRRAIIAVAELVAVRRLTRQDRTAACCECEGKLGLVLESVRRLACPVDCPGSLSMWTVPPEIEVRVREQLAEAIPVV